MERGDKIICIDNSNTQLQLNKEYTILYTAPELKCVHILELGYSFGEYRFKCITEIRKEKILQLKNKIYEKTGR